MTVEELVTKLGFEVDDKALKALDGSIEAVKRGILGLTVSFGGAGASLYAMVETTANATFAAFRMAEQIGISVQSFQRLQFAGKMLGMENEELGHSLTLLNRKLGEAAKGSQETVRAFGKVGISYAEIQSGSIKSDAALKRISDRFRTMPEGPKRTALAMELFGRSGARLIPLLLEGSQAIGKMGDEAEELGLVMTDAQVKAAVAFRQSVHFTESFFEGVKNQVGTGLMPAITDAIQAFNQFLKTNREIIKTNLTGFLKGTVGFLQASIRPAMAVGLAVAGIVHGFGGAEKATKLFLEAMALVSGASILFGMGKMVMVIWELATAFDVAAGKALLLNLKALALPLVIGAVVVAIGLLAEDIYQYFHGGKSLFGMILDDFDGLIKGMEQRYPKLAWMFDKIQGFGHGIKKAWGWAADTEGYARIQSDLNSQRENLRGKALGSKFDRLSSEVRTGRPSEENASSIYEISPSVTINMLPTSSPGQIATKVLGATKTGIDDALAEAKRHSLNTAGN